MASINNGIITANTNGSTVITIRTSDGGYTDTCSVTVNDISHEEDGGDDYTSLDLSSIQKDQSFTIYDGALDIDNQTVFADITLDDSSASQNIISIGREIDKWLATNIAVIHCYYPLSLTGSTRQVEVNLNFNTGRIKSNATITNNKFKMAVNNNGIYVNGTKLDISTTSEQFTSLVRQKTAKIGSVEGTKRSKATYNEIRIYNRLLSDEELITLTRI